MRISKMWKAVVAGLAAGTASLATALGDGVLTMQEGLTVAGAVVVAGWATYQVPNKQPSEDR